jgi:hypothetical protein
MIMAEKRKNLESTKLEPTQKEGAPPSAPKSDNDHGDLDNIRLDSYGDPQPGYNWNGALDRMMKLQEKEQGQILHYHGFEVDSALQSAGKHFGLPTTYGLFLYPRHPKNSVQPVIDSTIRKKCRQEIRVCGLSVLRAWLNKDSSFFDALARRAKIYFGPRSSGSSLKELEIIKIALELWHHNCGNPTRKEVRLTAEERGIKISAKDWPGYIKRCRLEFLKDRRGRPSKKQPSSELTDIHKGIPHPIFASFVLKDEGPRRSGKGASHRGR